MFGGEKDRRLPITLTLNDGQAMEGSIPAGVAGNLSSELNKEGQFLAFRDSAGRDRFISKASIMMVVSGEAMKDAKLPTLNNGLQPHRVLKVPTDADAATIRSAYMSLVKQYHPDQFSGPSVPPEISEYAKAMFQQINAAYNLLKDSSPAHAA